MKDNTFKWPGVCGGAGRAVKRAIATAFALLTLDPALTLTLPPIKNMSRSRIKSKKDGKVAREWFTLPGLKLATRPRRA
jgi:hypothetical protein